MEKKVIRQAAIKARNKLTEIDVKEKSLQISSLLEQQRFFQESENILFYYSHDKEVRTTEVLKKWVGQKNIYLPKFTGDHHFEAVLCQDLGRLKKSKYGILEPPDEPQDTPVKLDLIIVAGVAFDLEGNRIGRGKGYYDRFLADHKAVLKIALAYEQQIFDELPKEPYDEGVDIIITEKRIIHCHSSD